MNRFEGVEFKDGRVCSVCFDQIGLPYPDKGLGRSWRFTPISRAIELGEETKLEARKKEIERLNEKKEKELERLNEKIEIVFFERFFSKDDMITFYPNQGRLSIREKNQLVNYYVKNILEYEVLENGHSLTKGGRGAAAVGGLLFGGAGAIVGAVVGGKKSKEVVDSLQLKITLRDPKNPIRYLSFIDYPSEKDGLVYKDKVKRLSEIIGVMKVMIEEHERVKTTEKNEALTKEKPKGVAVKKAAKSEPTLVADELLKLKSLLDQGILTKAEFARQKKKLLL